MLVIYHSQDSLRARHAAALHMGWLHHAPEDLVDTWQRVGGDAAMQSRGLWTLGEDEKGRRVMALGQASQADVVHRAFHGVADIFELDHRSFLLQTVGAGGRWNERLVNGLRFLGLHRWARTVGCMTLRLGRPEAWEAVHRAKERLAVFER